MRVYEKEREREREPLYTHSLLKLLERTEESSFYSDEIEDRIIYALYAVNYFVNGRRNIKGFYQNRTRD